MDKWSAEIYADAHRNTREEIRSEGPRPKPNPTLLLCRKLIESALSDAADCDDAGNPTALALEAVEWLEFSCNWPRMGTGIPPKEARVEYITSFSWCCEWLGMDEHHVREFGLPDSKGAVFTVAATHQYAAPCGMRDVRRRWAAKRDAWQRSQRPPTPYERYERFCQTIPALPLPECEWAILTSSWGTASRAKQ